MPIESKKSKMAMILQLKAAGMISRFQLFAAASPNIHNVPVG
jgi:hypothetical protein